MDVVELTTKLCGLLAPTAIASSPSAQDDLIAYSMDILSSMIGSGYSPEGGAPSSAAYWDVGERIEKRLSGRNATRFQVLRAKLTTLKTMEASSKASMLTLLLTLSQTSQRSTVPLPSSRSVIPPALPPSTASKPFDPVPSSAAAHPATEPSTTSLGDAEVTHFSLDPPGSNGLPFAVSEALLIRDIVFVFEGIDGQYIKFDVQADAFRVDDQVGRGVPLSTRGIVSRLGELGWLHRRISEFIRTRSSDSVGAVNQALCAALQDELTAYFGELARIGSQLDQDLIAAGSRTAWTEAASEDAPTTSTTPTTTTSSDLATRRSPLTLRRLWVWAQRPLQRLRQLSMIADSAVGLAGGALASAVYQHSVHGDPFVADFCGRILTRICVRLFEMTKSWVLAGELKDDYQEFFVRRNASSRFWHDMYTLDRTMLPTFISPGLAAEVLLIGKSINFIRSSCGDGDWVMDASTEIAFDPAGDAPLSGLQAMTSAAGATVNKRLLSNLFDKFFLLEHLQALKRYLLLGQGDFISQLMDIISPELDKPAARQTTHILQGCLEGAIRSSNAQFERKEILDRLSVQCRTDISDMGTTDDSGWDVFTLTYHLGEPLNAVVTDDHMETYFRLFSFLWRLKRVEYTLSTTWCRHMTASHSLRSQPVLRPVLHKCHLLRSEMMNFASTLSSYVMFEVLEVSWLQLVKDLKAAESMEDLIAAHDRYLATIMTKELMSERTQSVAEPLKALLNESLRFAQMQEQLYARALAEVAQHERHVEATKLRAKAGKWGTDIATEESEGSFHTERAIQSLADQYEPLVDGISRKYHDLMIQLLEILDAEAGSVEEFRFLIFRLDFNEFYMRAERA